MEANAIPEAAIGAAMKVHSVMGPGLLESAYRACLVHELRKRELRVEPEWPVPVTYDGMRIDVGFRADLLIEDAVIVELKVVPKLTSIHEAQLLSYLRLGGLPVGLLINFGVPHLRDGIKRMVNRFPEEH